MAAVLHKLLKKPSALRIITIFNSSTPLNLTAPHSLHQTPLRDQNLDDTITLNPLLSSLNRDKTTFPQHLQIFPSFPFGYCLNPISSTGFDQLEVEEAGSNAQTVWADSVKKKRKRKMNKHKYKKLRKRLRRQT